MRSWAFAVLLACVGCVEDNLVRCGDVLCPDNKSCTPQGACRTPDEIDACAGKQEMERCLNRGFCIEGGCLESDCGNNTVEYPEVCDDGDIDSGDGCSATCDSLEVCGNSIADDVMGEECDDGNADDTDDCTNACKTARCGDGIEQVSEACDDGNSANGDGCSADCRSRETCGNDIVDVANNEHCDSGVFGLSGDGCTSSCRAEYDLWRDITAEQLSGRWGAQMVLHAGRVEHVMFGGVRSGQPSGPTNETWVHRNGGWEPRLVMTMPEARYHHAMAYHPGVGKTFVFGGTNGSQQFNGVWAWNGVAWSKVMINGVEPTPRHHAALAYFPTENALIMFGGIDNNGNFLDDTWKFDGVDKWTQIATTASPATNGGRMPYAKMFYDPNTKPAFSGLWLTGGSTSDTLARTYRYVPGTGWELWIVGPMASFIDPAIVVMNDTTLWFSGRAPTDTSGMNVSQEMYYFASSIGEWIPLTPATPPEARWSAAISSDGATAIMFGGLGKGSVTLGSTHGLREQAEWTWTLLPSTPMPAQRRAAAGAYDAVNGDVVMFGGADKESHNDTWRWATNVWKSVPSPESPTPRWHPAMAFDEKRQQVVLFGGASGCSATGSGGGSDDIGCGTGSGSGSGSGSGGGTGTGSGATYYNDTWVLSQRWIEAPIALPERPTARAGAAMTYDPVNERVVMFGGENVNGGRADTWAWNGTSWTQLASAPQAMAESRMVFDRANNIIMLYGGRGALGTVWLFDGTTWKEVTPASGPPPRQMPVLVYHPRRQRVLMFGGKLATGQLMADTWEWDGATRTWQQRFPLQAPPLRFDAAAAYDAVDDRIVVLGGGGPAGSYYTDAWAYSFVENSPLVERCDGTDGDLDGLMGCTDPDCWGRCDPYCPPAAPSCSSTRARCGDNMCTPVESEQYLLCVECTPQT